MGKKTANARNWDEFDNPLSFEAGASQQRASLLCAAVGTAATCPIAVATQRCGCAWASLLEQRAAAPAQLSPRRSLGSYNQWSGTTCSARRLRGGARVHNVGHALARLKRSTRLLLSVGQSRSRRRYTPTWKRKLGTTNRTKGGVRAR
jgi:hypothetical protein